MTLSTDNGRRIMAIALLGALWAAIVITAAGALRSAGQPTGAAPAEASAGVSPNDTTVSRALRLAPAPKPFAYAGSFEAPFRPVGRAIHAESAGGRGGSSGGAPYARKRLSLKGILTKDHPLAILEDAAGQTHINAEGDTVEGQKIVRIESTRVTLRDKAGTYELTVKE